MVQTGMTSPYPAAFPTQNGNQGDPPLKPVSVNVGDMKGDGLVAVGPTGDKGGGGGGGGGNPAQQQAVTNGQMQMANGEPNTQNATTVRKKYTWYGMPLARMKVVFPIPIPFIGVPPFRRKMFRYCMANFATDFHLSLAPIRSYLSTNY